MFTFYFIIKVYCMRIEVGDDCAVYKERIDNANGNQEELKRVILEIFDRVPIKNLDEVNIKKELGDMMHDYFLTDTDVVSEDKHI